PLTFRTIDLGAGMSSRKESRVKPGPISARALPAARAAAASSRKSDQSQTGLAQSKSKSAAMQAASKIQEKRPEKAHSKDHLGAAERPVKSAKRPAAHGNACDFGTLAVVAGDGGKRGR